MKQTRYKLLFGGFILFFILATTSIVLGVGTLAGTNISNQAYVDYKDENGNALSRVYSNTVTTTVSQVYGVNIVPETGSTSGSNGQTVKFLMENFNTGNGDDSYNLNYSIESGWTPTSVKFYYDKNNNHTFDEGTDTEMTSPYQTNPVKADDDFDIFMFVTIPDSGTAPDSSNTKIKVTSISKTDSNVTDYGTYTVQVSSANIASQKTHTPKSPKPGEPITYTITLENTGSSDGTSVVLSDPIPSKMTYIASSIKLNSTSKTDANDSDEADFNITEANKVTVNVGTIKAGAKAEIIFQVKVNDGTTAETAITNQAKITYQSGGTGVSTTTNSETLFVATSPGVNVTSTASPASGDRGDKITYPITVKNNGNKTDVIDMTYTSSEGWKWDLWYDANNDGIAGNDGDYLLKDNDGDGKIDTGSLEPGVSVSILAVATIPNGATDKSV
ncbi:MAG: DUF11 domain-containing protein, partial [Desulfobacterales bacterium]|nr:DUF11 domain-containing protein [Desulfobacterales bacterium]